MGSNVQIETRTNPALDEFERLDEKRAMFWRRPWELEGLPTEFKELLHDFDESFPFPSNLIIPEPNPVRDAFIARYAYAIPNEEALTALAAEAPLLELGAGLGYWAWLLRARGVDIAAYDPMMWRGVNVSGYCNDEDGTPHPLWTQVRKGGASQASNHPGRTLFLCWPPKDKDFAERCLRHYHGNTVVYVGEGARIVVPEIGIPGIGSCATQAFFDLLHASYRLDYTVQIPHWEGMQDQLEVWRRP